MMVEQGGIYELATFWLLPYRPSLTITKMEDGYLADMEEGDLIMLTATDPEAKNRQLWVNPYGLSQNFGVDVKTIRKQMRGLPGSTCPIFLENPRGGDWPDEPFPPDCYSVDRTTAWLERFGKRLNPDLAEVCMTGLRETAAIITAPDATLSALGQDVFAMMWTWDCPPAIRGRYFNRENPVFLHSPIGAGGALFYLRVVEELLGEDASRPEVQRVMKQWRKAFRPLREFAREDGFPEMDGGLLAIMLGLRNALEKVGVKMPRVDYQPGKETAS